jgi:transposase
MRTVACNIGRIAVVLDGMDLTDAQWAALEPTFRPRRRPDGRGRPWIDPRAVMNGVLWVLRTGAPWHDLPSRYPPYQTCHRRDSSCGSAQGGWTGSSSASPRTCETAGRSI